ncbi:MAG: T9SS type A sorting domain-containing protein [Bacteroidales bacterium]|nr:T9SS type A sorting domain-containing protein [Bacteroidales bacterium]
MKKTLTLLFALLLGAVLQAQEAVTSFPWTEEFPAGGDGDLPEGWVATDADGDGFTWFTALLNFGSGVLSSSISLEPDNYLTSPPLSLPADGEPLTLTWKIGAFSDDYSAEHYSVYIHTSPEDYGEPVFSTTLTNGVTTTNQISMADYAGQTVHISFRHHDCTNQSYLILESVSIGEGDTSSETHTATLINNGGGYMLYTTSVMYQYYSLYDSTVLTLPASAQGIIQLASFNINPIGYGVDPSAAVLEHLYIDGTEITLDGSDPLIQTAHQEGYTMYTYQFTAADDHTVKAIFGPLSDSLNITHTITLVNDGGGSMHFLNGSQGYAVENTITMTVAHNTKILVEMNTDSPASPYYDPTNAASQLNNVYIDGPEVDIANLEVYNMMDEPGYGYIIYQYEITADADHTLKAVFGEFGSDTTTATDTVYFTINAHSADESTGTVYGSGVYIEGDTITLTATPANGYMFLHWQDGNTENPRKVVASATGGYFATKSASMSEVEYVATFVPEGSIIYTITVASSNHEWGSVEGGGLFVEGDTVRLKAIAYNGYVFEGWQTGDTANPMVFVATADVEFTAIFREKTGIADVSFAAGVELYPNPALGSVNLRGLPAGARLAIIDQNGRTVHETTATAESVAIDLYSMPSGTYFVRIVHEGRTTTRKLLVR